MASLIFGFQVSKHKTISFKNILKPLNRLIRIHLTQIPLKKLLHILPPGLSSWLPTPTSYFRKIVLVEKIGSVGIGGVLHNNKGNTLFLFSKYVGAKDLNEAKVMTILDALRIFKSLFYKSSTVESNSSNAILWASSLVGSPYTYTISTLMKLDFYFLLFKLHSSMWVDPGNITTDAL